MLNDLKFRLVDLKVGEDPTNCSLNKLLIEASEPLWLSLKNPSNNETRRFQFENNRLSSCDLKLRPFTRIETNSKLLTVEFERSNQAGLEFLLLFNATLNTAVLDKCSELKCRTDYSLEQLNFSMHYSCIPKSLMCSCHMNCANYEESYNENQCEYFLRLNGLCHVGQTFLLNPKNREVAEYESKSESRSLRISPKQHNYKCANLTFSKEFDWIASPDFMLARSYAHNLDCFYHIALQPNQIVQLRFKYFNLNSDLLDLTVKIDEEQEVVKALNKKIKASNAFASLLDEASNIEPIFLGKHTCARLRF